MSIVTLATSITAGVDPFFTNGFKYGPPGNRLAVPLTTEWSFPASCTNTILGIEACSPPSFDGVYNYDGYYSPGVCFAGYSVGCVAAVNVTSVNCESIKPSETVAFCVPSGYDCDMIYDEGGYQRVLWAAPPLTATSLPWGTAVQIRWQSSDSAVMGFLYGPVSAAKTTSINIAQHPQSQTSTGQPLGATTTGGIDDPSRGTQETADKGSGLSAGSIAAIALGVVIVVLGSLLGAIFLVRRKRKQQAADLGETSGGGAADHGSSEHELSVAKKPELAKTRPEPLVTELGAQAPRTPELGLSVAEKPELAVTPSGPLSATELGAHALRTPELGLTEAQKPELAAMRSEPAATELETHGPRVPELPGSPVVAPVELNAGQRGGGRRGESWRGMFIG